MCSSVFSKLVICEKIIMKLNLLCCLIILVSHTCSFEDNVCMVWALSPGPGCSQLMTLLLNVSLEF